jgi:hypothetical protein
MRTDNLLGKHRAQASQTIALYPALKGEALRRHSGNENDGALRRKNRDALSAPGCEDRARRERLPWVRYSSSGAAKKGYDSFCDTPKNTILGKSLSTGQVEVRGVSWPSNRQFTGQSLGKES